MQQGCIESLFFNGDCSNEMGRPHGTPHDLNYNPTIRYWPNGAMLRSLAADFNGSTSLVQMSETATGGSCSGFTVACWVYCRGDGVGAGQLYYRGSVEAAGIEIYVTDAGTDYTSVVARVACQDEDAETRTRAGYPGLELKEWHHLAVTFDGEKDGLIRVYFDGKEPLTYILQQAGSGQPAFDLSSRSWIGNPPKGDAGFDGLVDTFLFYSRAVSQEEIKWLSNDLYHNAGGDLRVHIWEKRGLPDSSRVTHGMVCFQFDDGYQSHYSKAKPIFNSYGVVGNIAMISDFVDVGDRLTTPQLQDFIASGWEIISHSKTHRDPYRLSEAELRTEFEESKAALESLGTTVTHYAWPYSAPQSEYRGICAEYYQSAADGGSTRDHSLFALGHVTTDTPGETAIEYYKQYADEAYDKNRLLTFLMHKVEYEDAETLRELIEYCQAKNMPILTRSEAVANIKCTPPEPLYGAFSLRCQNISDSPRQLYQVRKFPPGDYAICFLAYTEGTPVTASDVVPFANMGGSNQVTDPHYEDQGGGVYLCWGTFTSQAAEYQTGLEVKAQRTVYVGLVSCYPFPIPPRLSAARLTNGKDDGLMLFWYGAPHAEYQVSFSDRISSSDVDWRCRGDELQGQGACLFWYDYGDRSDAAPFSGFVSQRYYRVKQLPMVVPSTR